MSHRLPHLTALIVLATALLGAHHQPADVTARPPIEPRPPALLAQLPDGLQPLTVQTVHVRATITGTVSRTAMTLVFHNPNPRVMEGELVFPLPEGATVSGYALDIDGVLVDASVVEKHQARVAFETEVRRGIDPGLVEWTRGNNFRTRVYPIPARGTRTVRVEYVADLVYAGDEARYLLPLDFDQPLKQFDVRVEVIQGPAEPVVAEGPAGLSFAPWNQAFLAETSLKREAVTEDLLITLPQVPRSHIAVESSEDVFKPHYFVIDDMPVMPANVATTGLADIERIGILWDASLSRARTDRRLEFAALERIAAEVGDAQVDVVVFRNQVEEAHQGLAIANGDASELRAWLEAVPCDGGTALGALTAPRSLPGDKRKDAPIDLWLLFSDGLGNVGDDWPDDLEAPVFALSADSAADHALLRHIGRTSGGDYFNLQQTDTGVVAARVMQAGSPPFSLLGVVVEDEQVVDVLPSGRVPVDGRVTVTGKLLADQATVTLLFGWTETVVRVTHVVKREGATDTGLIRRYWAQRRVDELAVLADANRAELLRLGQTYGLVTPSTSLLVMETLEQHLEHGVLPAESRTAMRAEYLEIVEQRAVEKAKAREERIAEVAVLWQDRVTWWETEFDFRKVQFAPDSAEGEELAEDSDLQGAHSREMIVDRRMATGTMAGAAEPVEEAEEMPMREDARDNAPDEDDDIAEGAGAAASITIQPWSPDTPYLNAMKAAGLAEAYDVYLDQRGQYFDSPAFYLDCSSYLLDEGEAELGLRVLTAILDLELEEASLMRVVAHKAHQIGELELAAQLFEDVGNMRPEEPQSYRDLALVLGEMGEYERSLDLLNEVVVGEWDARFPEIQTIALMEANRLLSVAEHAGADIKNPLDPRLVKLLDVDMRIILTWDTDLTDMDLWVTEPSGEKCMYNHARTQIGGRMSRDFTRGYGPEEYWVRRGMPGQVRIQVNYYGSGQVTLTGGTTIQVDVFTNYGRADEHKQSITKRLTTSKEVVDIGEVMFEGG